MNVVTVESLAAEFSHMVRCELTLDQLAEVRRRNQTPQYTGCCATHDFTDTNMLMLATYASLAGIDEDEVPLDDEGVQATMNSAWDMARAAEFNLHPKERT